MYDPIHHWFSTTFNSSSLPSIRANEADKIYFSSAAKSTLRADRALDGGDDATVATEPATNAV